MGNYNDVLLEQLADQGDGFYAYVDDARRGAPALRRRPDGTLETVALDAKAQVEFDPDVVARLPARRLREPGGRRRRTSANDTSPPARSGPGHAVTALYALRLTDGVGSGEPSRDGPRPLDRS